MSLLTGLKTYFSFENNLIDQTGNGHDGTGYGAWEAQNGGYFVSGGKKGSAFSMTPNGVTLTPWDGLYKTNIKFSPVSLASTWSVSAWVKFDGTPANTLPNRFIEQESAGTGKGIRLAVQSKIQLWDATNSDVWAGAVESNSTIPYGWHHVTITHSGAVVKFYIDGVLDAQINGYLNGGWSPDKLLGSSFDRGSTAVFLDELGIWDRVLTDSEVAQLYNSGNGLTYSELGGGGGGSPITRMLKSLVHLTASKSAKFEEGLDVNSQKITNIGSGLLSTDGVNLGQLTAVSSSIISYANSADAAFQDSLDSVSGSMLEYILAQDEVQTTASLSLSSSIKSYVDAADLAQDTATGQLSSSLKSYIDAADTAQDTATGQLSSSIKSYVDAADLAQDNTTGQLSSSIKSYVDAADLAQDNATGQLSSSISSALVNEATARADEDLTFLKLDGSRAMSGSLDMGGQNIVSAKSGSFSGDVTIGGNLQVNGTLASIATDDFEVADKLVTIAKGAINGAAADGAGLEVDGAGASFVFDNDTNKWVSNIGLEVSNEGTFDAAMKLSGSAFTNITTAITGGKFDVSDAIHALDQKVGSNSTALVEAYDSLRQVITGTISTGSVAVDLAFATSDINSVALDVMVNEGAGYTNDLVSAKMSVISSKINVRLDAPVTPVGSLYRIIAINAKKGGLALTPEVMSTLIDGLESFWNFENNTLDSFGSNHGTPYYYPTIFTSPVTGAFYTTGKTGQGLCASPDNIIIQFNTWYNKTYVDLPNINLGHSWSVMGWVNLNGTNPYSNKILTDSTTGYGLNVTLNGKINYGSFWGESSTSVSAGWHMIGITYDGAKLKFYLDGNEDGIVNAPYGAYGTAGDWTPDTIFNQIGTDNSCILDSLGVWKRPLTSTEVIELYNGGTGKTYPF